MIWDILVFPFKLVGQVTGWALDLTGHVLGFVVGLVLLILGIVLSITLDDVPFSVPLRPQVTKSGASPKIPGEAPLLLCLTSRAAPFSSQSCPPAAPRRCPARGRSAAQ